MSKVHRWQPTGYTPCGRKLSTIRHNNRSNMTDVTCEVCRYTKTLVSPLKLHVANMPNIVFDGHLLDVICDDEDQIQIEVQKQRGRKVVYIHANGRSIVRICRIKNLESIDHV